MNQRSHTLFNMHAHVWNEFDEKEVLMTSPLRYAFFFPFTSHRYLSTLPFIPPLIFLGQLSFVLTLPSILSSGHQGVSWGDVKL